MLNVKLEHYMAGPHALLPEVSDYIYIYIYTHTHTTALTFFWNHSTTWKFLINYFSISTLDLSQSISLRYGRWSSKLKNLRLERYAQEW